VELRLSAAGALTGGSVECEPSFRSLPGTTEAGGIYRIVEGDVLVRIGEKVWGMTAGCCGEPAGRGHEMRGVNGRGNGGAEMSRQTVRLGTQSPREGHTGHLHHHQFKAKRDGIRESSGLSVFRGSGP
jgi:hypothetical protein